MLFPQLRNRQPLKIGSVTISADQQLLLACLALLTFFISYYQFHGPLPASYGFITKNAYGTLPRYWSATREGGVEGVTNWEKPLGLKVVGLVFFGRPAVVSILDCYLKRNLVDNGGYLDEVIFIARTNRSADLEWLDALVMTTPAYRRHNTTFGNLEDLDYASAWDVCENGTMYIKMDDDVVFLEDTAIPTIVQTKLLHPEYLVLSANIVNQPSLSWIHHHLGAIRPYLPELAPPTTRNASSWRASELPTWSGPAALNVTENFTAPFDGHRWLPLPAGSSIDNTPIAAATYDAFSPALWRWTLGAQQHYSFFEHLENNDLWRYKFPSWDYKYRRMGIQFVAVWGDDLVQSRPMHKDDEYFLTEVMTRRTGRHAVVDGRALVAHYSFLPQKNGMAATDVLDRYRAFARENICY